MVKSTIFQMPRLQHSKSKKQNPNIFPFAKDQLKQFMKELEEAGGFHALMFQKKALDHRMGMKYITLYKDVQRYKDKYLTGIYQSLHPFYDTEMPFIFWSELYEILLKSEFSE